MSDILLFMYYLFIHSRKLQTAPDGLPNMSPRDKKWEPPTFKKTSLYDDERGDSKDSRRNRSPGTL